MRCDRAVRSLLGPIVALVLVCSGCLGPKLTGSKIQSDDQEAMPYYLPKPYLLVTKNFNLIETTKTTTTTTPVFTSLSTSTHNGLWPHANISASKS